MIRRLSREEREIWGRLRRSVRPLRPEPLGPEPLSAPADEGAPEPDQAAPLAPTSAASRARQAPPPLTPLPDRDRRRVLRGLTEIDARIDLHGMGQERAFSALVNFLRRSQARGARLVLVITGKGRVGEDGRGVLRQVVPLWLARPDFRDLVLGFEAAGRHHGGEGALYVRVRRKASRSSAER